MERTVPEGTVAVYNCNRGYSRRGNNMGACVAGHWMGDLPTCTGECGMVGVWVWNDRGVSSRKMCQMGRMCLRLV